MNRALIAAACLAVVLPACADKSAKAPTLTPDQQYVRDIRAAAVGSAFVRAKDSDLDSFGHTICTLLDQSTAPADLATAMMTGRKFSEMSSADAAFAISAAVHDFCRMHADVIQAWNGAPTPTTSTTTTTTTLPRRPRTRPRATTTTRPSG